MSNNTQFDVVNEITTTVNRTYKDRVFRMLFQEKKELLNLYNALNGTAYDNEDDLKVNTLENAIFMKMKNDISFLITSNMYLFEHQSSYCPNMPLRGLFYLMDLYKKELSDLELSTHTRVRIPTPQYIVFYNGLERQEEEFEQKLSESFETKEPGCMELTVRSININLGKNEALMEKCRTLYEYACFIAKVREYRKNEEFPTAVKLAVEDCIRNDILREFLIKQKSEVISMSIYEYNEEYAKKSAFEEGVIEGKSIGIAEGKSIGIAEGKSIGITEGKSIGIAEGKSIGIAEGKIESVMRLVEKDIMTIKEACDIIGISVEAYDIGRKQLTT